MPTPLTETHFVWCYIFPEIFRKLAFREGQDETSGNSIWSSLMRLLGYFSSFFCGKYERNDHSRLCDPKRKRCLSSDFRPWRRGWSTPTASPTPHASASLRWTGENLWEEVGVSSLKGQPGQAKGLGKYSHVEHQCEVQSVPRGTFCTG